MCQRSPYVCSHGTAALWREGIEVHLQVSADGALLLTGGGAYVELLKGNGRRVQAKSLRAQ